MTRSGPLSFVYSELNFQNCPVAFREILASQASLEKIDSAICRHAGMRLEFVNIATCNRFAICLFGNLSYEKIIDIYQDLAQSKDFSRQKLQNFLTIEIGVHALEKLFRVVSGLDSMILGESQILGQIKDAFSFCFEKGFAGNQANHIFSQAFRVAKKIRQKTGIGANTLSIGHASIQIVNRVFHNLKDKKCLIFGAGEMARITSQYLLSHRITDLAIANRSFGRAQDLAKDLNPSVCYAIDLQRAIETIHEFDVCFFAVAGNHTLLTPLDLAHYPKKRAGNLSVMVDMSVPRKVDPALSKIENLFLFNVDDLNPIVEQNRAFRKAAALQAERILDSEINAFHALQEQKENLSSVGKLHSWLTNVVNLETDRYLKKHGIRSEDHHVIADAVAKKIISHAASLAKNNQKMENPDASVGEMIDFLFDVSQQPLLPENQKKEHNVIAFSNSDRLRKVK